MNTQTHLLKQIRTDADVMQQDVAFLLNIDTGNLARYENEKRNPSLEIVVMYHILFGVPISEILSPLEKRVKEKLMRRSRLLLSQAKAKKTPKSTHSISYIEAVVNDLIHTSTYDCLVLKYGYRLKIIF